MLIEYDKDLINRKAQDFLPKGSEIVSIGQGERRRHIRNECAMIVVVYKYNGDIYRAHISGQLSGIESTYKKYNPSNFAKE